MHFTESFWTERYQSGQTGWNVGYPTPPIAEYADQLSDRGLKILIPGAGNAYEAEYLHEKGFTDVTVLDISPVPLQRLAGRFPGFPKDRLVQGNFFDHRGAYDLVLEQTFFCALHPSQRQDYADKMHELLKPGGRLAGVWFSFPLRDGQELPPFGGSAGEYERYFRNFASCRFKPCRNSIPPRAGNELFGIIQR